MVDEFKGQEGLYREKKYVLFVHRITRNRLKEIISYPEKNTIWYMHGTY